MKKSEKLQDKFSTLQEKIDDYNRMEHFVSIYNKSPDNWTIDIKHYGTSMLGTSFDYSFGNFRNDEIKNLIAKKIINNLNNLEKELEELLKDI
jgi:hypothetical protein